MAFERGIAQSVHVTTLATSDHLTETAPTTPVVTVSLDGGATFEATDNAAAATLYGVSLLLSAAETNRAFVRVRVTSANCDPRSLDFYFEENYTQAKAAFLDAAISGREASGAANAAFVAYDPPSRAEATSDANSIIAVLTAIKGPGWTTETLEAIYDAITALGAGSGAAAITLTVKKAGVATQGVPVTLQASGGVNIQVSDENGQVTFNRDGGSWSCVIEDHAAYTGYTGTVVVAGGVVTSPADGILIITGISLPVPASADNYVVYGSERAFDGGAIAGAGDVVVTVEDAGDNGMYTDADGEMHFILGTEHPTDLQGQWSFEISKKCVASGAQITIKRVWVNAVGDSPGELCWAVMDASVATELDQIAFAQWKPKKRRI